MDRRLILRLDGSVKVKKDSNYCHTNLWASSYLRTFHKMILNPTWQNLVEFIVWAGYCKKDKKENKVRV